MPEGAIYAVLKQVRTTSAPVGLVSQKVLDFEFDRKGAIIFNDSDKSAFLTYGPIASIVTATAIIGPFAKWDLPGPAVWCGEVSVVRELASTNGSGSLVLTEMI